MRRNYIIAGVAAAGLTATTLALAPVATAQDTSDSPDLPAEVPDGYYDDAEGKTGDELKTALNGIISGHEELSYDAVKEAIPDTDADPDSDGNVLLIYSGESESGDGGAWNREHVWAKSHGDFGTSPGPGTDLHHLRPCDETVNSTRSNLDFDEGGEEVEGAPGNFYDEDSFEPADEWKGDVARMILYMDVRYEGDDAVDLEVNDEVDNSPEPAHGRLSLLKEWNAQDPPDEFEQNRNDVIFDQYQNNRNPFIDNPDWVDEIWS